jgi:surface polysaccharide O-acyltransferase-like enzyme
MMEQKRSHYLDLLRVFATLGVVLLHVAAQIWGYADPQTKAWIAANGYNSLVRWTVPVFVMISGALFLAPDKEISLKKLYGKNILRLAIAFLFWSLIYACYTLIGGFDAARFFATLINGNGHLWFLPMMIGLYMAIPFFRLITKEEKLTRYFLILAAIFNIGAYTLFSIILPLLPDTPLATFITLLQKNYSNMAMQVVGGYSFYFVLGYYLHSRPKTQKKHWGAYLFGTLGLATTFLLCHYAPFWTGLKQLKIYHNYSVWVALTSIGIFLFFKDFCPTIQGRAQKILLTLSQWSFGVYLCHELLIKILAKSILPAAHPLFTIPLLAGIVYLGGLAVSAVLNQIPILKKYTV